jgi:hypothetical protein
VGRETQEETTMKYNDGLCSGGRIPQLWLVDAAGGVHRFGGKHVDGVCAVLGADYAKNGKWSNTDYTLELAPGCGAVELLAPLHGQTWPQVDVGDAHAWFEKKAGRPVSLASFADAVRAHYPKTWERWEAAAAAVESLESASGGKAADVVEVVIHGRGRGPDGRWVGFLPDGREFDADAPPAGVAVIDRKKFPGVRGGYLVCKVAMTCGT